MINQTSLEAKIRKLENRVSSFLQKPNFDGFSSDDLFIKRFIGKPWGQDIAALSNMAEGYLNLHLASFGPTSTLEHLQAIIERAIHPKVNPYNKPLSSVRSLGFQGYYLEHLNTSLGCYRLAGGEGHKALHRRVSEHLAEISLQERNAHARLIPHVKMRWCADQAAILNSLWLYDQSTNCDLHEEPSKRWLDYIRNNCLHATGLVQTEVMNCKKYSKQPRGCSLAYLVHYSRSFAPDFAKEQWCLFKKHMFSKALGLHGFREYLPSYKGGMTPDTGPIIGGLGVAATGLAMKTASCMSDSETFEKLRSSAKPVLGMAELLRFVPLVNKFSAVATDVLATSIQFSGVSRAIIMRKNLKRSSTLLPR